MSPPTRDPSAELSQRLSGAGGPAQTAVDGPVWRAPQTKRTSNVTTLSQSNPVTRIVGGVTVTSVPLQKKKKVKIQNTKLQRM